MRYLILFFVAVLLSSCGGTKQATISATITDLSKVPEWSRDVIWYQIFVERFYNGDRSNDPTPESIQKTWPYFVPEGWQIKPWTGDWHANSEWENKSGLDFNGNTQLRRYGGDIQGIIDKLDYLKDLGVTALYLNPVNDAPSLHKFDARNYRHIDVNFGPDPDGDRKIIESEIPDDPATWQWTSADKLFLKLIEEVHKRDMRIIVDYSWNHTGQAFWAFDDLRKKQEKSAYKHWYNVLSFDDPLTKDTSEFDFEGWLNIKNLPELKKLNVKDRKHGHPYSGQLQPDVQQHVFNVTRRWLAPNGDVTKGLDGFRLDVADQLPMEFWKEYRAFVKSINPEAYLVGEIWWEEWPDKLMDPRPYIGEGAFDAVMFYQVFKPARGFFGVNEDQLTANQFVAALKKEWAGMDRPVIQNMMGLNASHDTPRLLTSFQNSNKYKHNAHPGGANNYDAGKPDAESIKRTKLYLMHQFTSLSSPHVWNGDEMGMWGADDPDPRKPLWWPEFEFEPESAHPKSGTNEKFEVGFNKELHAFYKKLINLRRNNEVLTKGEITFNVVSDKALSYTRSHDKDKIWVAFNVGNTPVKLDIPKNTACSDLLTGEILTGKSVLELLPLEGRILRCK